MKRVPSPTRALYAQLARVAKATAAPARLELLDLLAQAPRTVETLAHLLGRPLANTSHHLKVLRQARLVETTRSGQFITYHLADASVAGLLLQMRTIADARLPEIGAITRTYVERRGQLEPVDQRELFRRVQAGAVVVIDVRPAAEFDAGHLPGAISMPLDELERRLPELARDREIVAYCRGPYCVMSFDAMALLRARGLTAHRLEAGVVEWRARAGSVRAIPGRPAAPRSTLPLHTHALEQPSILTADALMQEVRRTRRLKAVPVPPVCVLDFDGDLFDGLVNDGTAQPVVQWACFHTPMVAVRRHGLRCGVVPRTIGGPFAVLVAEQLIAAGARVVVGLTSSGRLAPALPLPSLVIATEAIRDEGTSLHYLPASERVSAPSESLVAALADSLASVAPVTRGLVWTTDAPYRETRTQVRHWSSAGALAVEMQAASLFAFAETRQAAIGVVAMVSNSGDHAGEQFDTGEHAYRVAVLDGIIAGAARMIRADRA